MTIREEPFKNYRSRTSKKWKAKFEEAKKQMIKKNDDGRSYANWQTSSWSWAPTYDLDIFILATLEFERNA